MISKMLVTSFDTVVSSDKETLYYYIVYRAVRNAWDGRKSVVMYYNQGAYLDLKLANKIYDIATQVIEVFLQRGKIEFKEFMEYVPFLEGMTQNYFEKSFLSNPSKFGIKPVDENSFNNPDNDDLYFLNIMDFPNINTQVFLQKLTTSVFNNEALNGNRDFLLGYYNESSFLYTHTAISRMSTNIINLEGSTPVIIKERFHPCNV